MTNSLKKLALKGTAWTVVGYGSSQIIRFLSNIVLTRLLVPEYFGIMAIVNTFRQGIELFSDLGVAQNIVRSENGDNPDFLNTAWTIQILRGGVIWIVFMLMAWPVATFYEEPLLFQVLLVISITVLLGGINSVRIYSLNRHMQLGRVTLFELSTQIVSVVTMLLISMVYPSVWALVIGAIVGKLFRAYLSYKIFPGHKHKFLLNPEFSKEILSFGIWIFVTSIVMFASDHSDRLILGKLVPLDILGVYSIAYMFANIPQTLMRQVSYKVMFPVISKQIDLPRRQLKRKLDRYRWRLTGLLIPVFALLAGAGDFIILFLYDERYAAAAWMMPLLALGGWFSALFFMANPCLLALGKPAYAAQSRILRLVVVSVGLVISFRFFGIPGAIVVISLSDLPAYFAIQYGLSREKIGCLWQDMNATGILIVVLAAIFGLRSLLGVGLPFDILFE